MLFDFGLATHFHDAPTLTPFELLIQGIFTKTHLHERHLNRTIQLYRNEYRQNLAELRVVQEQALSVARTKYDEIIKSSGDTEENHYYADHDSGWSDITSHFAEQEEYLQKEMLNLVDYFNKSALVVAYSLFESSFRDVCLTLQEAFKKRIGLKHMISANYLKSMLEYLDLVLEVDVTSLTPHISKIEHLQFLRNRIVHEGGIIALDKADEKLLKQIISQSGKSVALENDEHSNLHSIRIKKVQYIISYYQLIRTFFRDALYLIDLSTDHSLLRARIKHLFGFVSADLSVTIKSVMHGVDYAKVAFELHFPDKSIRHIVGCNMNIKKSKEPKIAATNQLDNSTEELDRVIKYLETYPGQVLDTLRGFTPSDTFTEISFMIFNGDAALDKKSATI